MRPALSAGEPPSQHLLPGAGQLPDGTVPTGDRHQHGFRRSGQLWSPAVTPVQIGRCQAYAAGEVPPRQLRGAQAVTQHTTQPFGRDLARQTERAADVLMMDGDIEQSEPPPKVVASPCGRSRARSRSRSCSVRSDASSSTHT